MTQARGLGVCSEGGELKKKWNCERQNEQGLVAGKGKEARRPESGATDLKTRRLEEGEVKSVWTC